ncbi:hypothetical protein BLA29_005638, partial [Euroglyphus maynei]
MDGFHKPQNRYSHVRGCRLCNDNDNDLEYDNNHGKYGILHRSGDIRILRDGYDEEAEEIEDRFSSCSTAENNEKHHEQSSTFYKSFEMEKDGNESEGTSPKKQSSSSDEFV